MKIQDIIVNTRRQAGEYQHDDVTIKAIMEDGDDPISVRAELMSISLGKVSAKAAPKAKAVKPVAAKAEEPSQNAGQITLPEGHEVDVAAVAKKAPVKKKAVKKKVSKDILYDRSLDVHKKEIGKLLDEVEPSWRKSYLTEAKELSLEFNGKAFLDNKGNVLDSFRNEFSAALSARV